VRNRQTLIHRWFLLLLLSGIAPAFAVDTAAQPGTSTLNSAVDSQSCNRVSANPYKKSLVITRFPRLNPASSNPGALHDAETALPAFIVEALQARQLIASATSTSPALQDVTTSTPLLLAKATRQLANRQRAQLVITGTIDDMSMAETTELKGLYTRFINGFRDTFSMTSPKDKRQRLFSMYLQLRDGITGELLFDAHYRTLGVWPVPRVKEAGFDSEAFRRTDYGKQVMQLIAHASDQLADAIECQPHIATIESRPGQDTVVVHSGANHGLRVGDLLSLHQVTLIPVTDAYQQQDTRLIDRRSPVQLLEVYPSHSIARVDGQALPGGRFVALTP